MYKNNLLKASPLLIAIFLYMSYPVYSQRVPKKDTVIKIVKTDRPENTCFSITNKSDSMAVFSLKFNDKFFKSLDEIIESIKKSAGYKTDSLYYYAWKFVSENIYANGRMPFEVYEVTLTIHMNSVGSGACGKRASVLSDLWKIFGYKTRVWDLHGQHAVPEVFFDDSWHMLDPMHRVYFLNENYKIAGVEELIKKPEMISGSVNTKYSKNEKDIDIYRQPEGNRLINKESLFFEGPDSMLLQLPPHSVFVFPGIFTKKINSGKIVPYLYYANCKLTVPPTWQGNIVNSLIIADVQGQGTIHIDGVEYNVGDKEIDSLIYKNKRFIQEINVKKLTDSLELIYLLNPYMTDLEEENKFVFTGINVKSLSVESFYVPDSVSVDQSLRKNYFYRNKRRSYLLRDDLSAYTPCVVKSAINNIQDLTSQLEQCLLCVYAGKNKQYIAQAIEKVNKVFSDPPEGFRSQMVFKILNDAAKDLSFYDLEHAGKESIMEYLKRSPNQSKPK